jgi:hypothetical protein
MKNLKEYLITETVNDNVIAYFKKTFKNITIEDRTEDEFDNPFDDGDGGDWVEIFLNDFDTTASFAYDPNRNLFQLVVDSCFVTYDGSDIDFDDEGGEGYDATPENLKLYNKRAVKKICNYYDNEY